MNSQKPFLSEPIHRFLDDGVVIPALPLALTSARQFDETRQRALLRYYMDAGSGGVAVGVHSTQFEIRDPEIGLFEPVLSLAAEEMKAFEARTNRPLIKVAGVVGKSAQAVKEAELASRMFGLFKKEMGSAGRFFKQDHGVDIEVSEKLAADSKFRT